MIGEIPPTRVCIGMTKKRMSLLAGEYGHGRLDDD